MLVRLLVSTVLIAAFAAAQEDAKLEVTTTEIKNSGTPETLEFYGGKGYRNGRFTSQEIPYVKLKVRCDYFGVLEGDVGSCAAIKAYKLAEWFKFSYGGGIIFGRGETPGPAAIVSAELEKRISRNNKFTAETSMVQAFRFSGERQRDRYSQSCTGIERRRVWFGGCAEFLHHREEAEWSGGPAVQYAFGKSGFFVGGSLFFNGSIATPIFGLGFKASLRE